MSVTETVLIFGVIPVGVVLIIAALTTIGGTGRNARRYRPGRPFDFTPVWFLSAPEHLAQPAGAALPAGAQVPALTATEIDRTGAPQRAGATGGASDRW